MRSFLELLSAVISLYIWVLIIWAVLSTLISFNIINTHNRVIPVLMDFLYRVTEPALRPIRRVVPLLGGVDISPLILILLLHFLRNLLFEYFV
jgi:YggT family protein